MSYSECFRQSVSKRDRSEMNPDFRQTLPALRKLTPQSFQIRIATTASCDRHRLCGSVKSKCRKMSMNQRPTEPCLPDKERKGQRTGSVMVALSGQRNGQAPRSRQDESSRRQNRLMYASLSFSIFSHSFVDPSSRACLVPLPCSMLLLFPGCLSKGRLGFLNASLLGTTRAFFA